MGFGAALPEFRLPFSNFEERNDFTCEQSFLCSSFRLIRGKLDETETPLDGRGKKDKMMDAGGAAKSNKALKTGRRRRRVAAEYDRIETEL